MMHILFCLLYLLILCTLNKSYCVTCSKILPVSVFCVLQGSGVTPLNYDATYDMDFVANLGENTTAQKFGKSVNISQTYERMYSGTFFIETRCRNVEKQPAKQTDRDTKIDT